MVLLAGCAQGGGPAGPVDWDDVLDLGAPGAFLETVEDVEYYPACGNEVLRVDGEEWFPFTPANPEAYPTPRAAGRGVAVEASLASAVGAPDVVLTVALPAVVAPGPGDDSGTLTVYDGGLAHWTSQSGTLETWLTPTEIEYAWVC